MLNLRGDFASSVEKMTSFLIHSHREHKLWSAPLGGTVSTLQPLGSGKGEEKEEEEMGAQF